MNWQHERFGDRVDFFQLDINDGTNQETRFQHQRYHRSTYALTDKDGTILPLCIDPLYETAPVAEKRMLPADFELRVRPREKYPFARNNL